MQETTITTKDGKRLIIRSEFEYSEHELEQLRTMNMRDLYHVGSVREFLEVSE